MVILILFSFISGIVTVLSPCILPVLPVLLLGAVSKSRARSFGIVLGFVASFTVFTLAFSTVVRWFGISADVLRIAAIVLLAIFGAVLLLPGLQSVFEGVTTWLLSGQKLGHRGRGFWSGVFIGITLGLLWTPCVGPIMAAVITLAAASAVTLKAVMITLAYAIGTALPMLIIMFGGKHILERVSWLKSRAGLIQQGFGVVILLLALALYQGYDRSLETWLLSRFPNYGKGLTALENNKLVGRELNSIGYSADLLQGGATEDNYPLAPELIPGGEWFNSPPLALKDLRGKVVMVDFWTYTCINCIRTLPTLNAWHERYADKGLVIIGVHTPEFEFEKDSSNVAKAVRDLGVKYPVMQDNNYATWNAYHNRYWPAKYFIDKNGRLRATHFGEGDEEESEAVIRTLLSEAGSDPGAFAARHAYSLASTTPETYLGLDRSERFASLENLSAGKIQYSLPPALEADNYAYQGQWSLSLDHSSPGMGARLDFHFSAKEVFLVMRNPGPGPIKVRVLLDGKDLGREEQGQDVHKGVVDVHEDRLYHLISLRQAGEHTLTLKFYDGKVELFAFTFG